jgi:hypothetical protein
VPFLTDEVSLGTTHGSFPTALGILSGTDIYTQFSYVVVTGSGNVYVVWYGDQNASPYQPFVRFRSLETHPQ